MRYRCAYGSPACADVEFKGTLGARQHWSCLPGTIYSGVATGLKRSLPHLREDDRALLAAVAAWAAFGATPALSALIADEVVHEGRSAERSRAMAEALRTTLGADVPAEVEEAGRLLLAHASGTTPASPQVRPVLGLAQLHLGGAHLPADELEGDASGERYVIRHLGKRAQEAFWVVPIDAGSRARAIVEVGVGKYHSVGVPIPAVLTAVLTSGTDLFWVAHNHPSGEVSPSAADADLTALLAVAAQQVDLHLVDHVIVGPGMISTSLARLGLHVSDWGDLADPGHEPATKS